MKTRGIFLVAVVLITASAACAGLWDPPVLNPSFEAQDLTGGKGWDNWIDDWFDSSYWGSFIQNEGGDTPDTPYGKNIGGVEGIGGAVYQQVGTWDNDTTYEISFFIGKVRTRAYGALQIALWAGGDPELAADHDDAFENISVESTGATMLDSIIIDSWPDNPLEALSEEIAVSLNTGTGFIADDPLWLQFSQTVGVVGGYGAQAFFDNVQIGPPTRACLPDPANGEIHVPITTDLNWQPPTAYTPTKFDLHYTKDPNFIYGITSITDVTETTYDPPADLDWETEYFWRVDSYDGATVHQGWIWHFTTVPETPVILNQPVGQTVVVQVNRRQGQMRCTGIA